MTPTGSTALVVELEAVKKQLDTERQLADRLAEALRDIRDNYDCDSDAHKYGTGCQCCIARAALSEHQRARGEGG